MSDQDELVQIHSCQGLLLAELYKSKLEAAGIPVLLKYESAGLIFGITMDGLGEVQLLVPAEFAEEATALLEERTGLHEDDSDGDPLSPLE
jgi:hypothetical protein